jgi:hypothetical protein
VHYKIDRSNQCVVIGAVVYAANDQIEVFEAEMVALFHDAYIHHYFVGHVH